MFTLKAFRAVENQTLSEEFVQGHTDVLKDYGVKKVTSASHDWVLDPNVYVVAAIDSSTNQMVGGVRVHIAGPQARQLPMEAAITIVDTKVHALIQKYWDRGTGELCGLWNAKAVAGVGIGSYYLMRAGISLSPHLGINTLFALCAPHTLQISVEKGFEVEASIGKNGTFIYPKLDLVATSIVIHDPAILSHAIPLEQELITGLIRQPNMERMEHGPKGALTISYQLELKTRTPDS